MTDRVWHRPARGPSLSRPPRPAVASHDRPRVASARLSPQRGFGVGPVGDRIPEVCQTGSLLVGRGTTPPRSPHVARAAEEEVNAALTASKSAAMTAIKGVPLTAAPGDFFGGAVFVFIIPLFLGAAVVYLLTVFWPETVLTDDQMVKYKKAEKKYFLEKRGAIRDPDAPMEKNRAGRRKAKSLKGKRSVKS
ncbi:hypothetical protein AK812_SmicGene22285 [Symbiodinium microadriaticum]|uniref:Uncharacterized protein n=1 Tax=Symbiodinium microadriaticum TaxID=2951 RepID=A0A1Q9DK65_SYMMI|nr:hypothetical protein AK812_SmicGene22285 [Symbiodinium microadriaticum]